MSVEPRGTFDHRRKEGGGSNIWVAMVHFGACGRRWKSLGRAVQAVRIVNIC